MIDNHSISLSDNTGTEGSERVLALMGDLFEEATSKKVSSVLFFSIGHAERKKFFDKFPTMQMAMINLRDLPVWTNFCCDTEWNSIQHFCLFPKAGKTNRASHDSEGILMASPRSVNSKSRLKA